MFDIALFLQVVVFLIVVGVFLASGQASLFHPLTVYLAFHVLAFVLRPLFVHYLGFNSVWLYMGMEPSPAQMTLTLAVTSVALVVFAGASLLCGRAQTNFPAAPARQFSPLQLKALLVTTLLLLPIAAYSIYATRKGIAGERSTGGIYIMTTTTGYIYDAQCMIGPLLCAWMLATRFHWGSILVGVLYVGYRVWFGWARWTIVLFLLTIVLTFCWSRRKKWLPIAALILAVPVLIIFNILGQNRDYLKSMVGETWQEQSDAPIDSIEHASLLEKIRSKGDTQDFANFDYLTFVLAVVPERSGMYTYGKQYLQLFTEPIPRILWSGKPVGSPVRLFDINAFGNFVGLTFSLPGDGWMSGGWIGMVITMALVGLFLGTVHKWFWRHVNDPMISLLYLSALPMTVQWFRDGGISIAKFMLWTWLPLLIWLGLVWILGGRYVPGVSFILRRGERVRVLRPQRGSSNTTPSFAARTLS